MSTAARGHLAALFSIIVWAMTFVSTKVLLTDLTAMEVTFIRSILAYFALAVFSPHPIKTHGLKGELPFILSGLSGVTAYFLFQNIGLTFTTATNSSIILNLIPVITALLAWWILKDRTGIHPLFFVGSVLAMAGITIISLSGGTAGLHLFGDLLTLGAAFVWGFYTLLSPKVNGSGFSVIQVTRRIYFWGLMIPAMFAFRFRPDIHILLRPDILLNLLFLGIGASAVCFVTWNCAIRQLGPVKVSLYVYVQPVITVIASAFILRETMTGDLLLGIVLSLTGVILSGIRPRRKM